MRFELRLHFDGQATVVTDTGRPVYDLGNATPFDGAEPRGLMARRNAVAMARFVGLEVAPGATWDDPPYPRPKRLAMVEQPTPSYCPATIDRWTPTARPFLSRVVVSRVIRPGHYWLSTLPDDDLIYESAARAMARAEYLAANPDPRANYSIMGTVTWDPCTGERWYCPLAKVVAG